MVKIIILEKKLFGININGTEIGFTYPKILDIIEYYYNNEIPILGGDIYIKIANKYEPTYDNWYIEKKRFKNSYLQESIQYARKYIEEYPDKDKVAFVLVPN